MACPHDFGRITEKHQQRYDRRQAHAQSVTRNLLKGIGCTGRAPQAKHHVCKWRQLRKSGNEKMVTMVGIRFKASQQNMGRMPTSKGQPVHAAGK